MPEIPGQTTQNPIVNFNEPLQVPKKKPKKTKQTKQIVLGDATQPKIPTATNLLHPPHKKNRIFPFFHFLGNFYVLRVGAFAIFCFCLIILWLAGVGLVGFCSSLVMLQFKV